MRYLKLYENFTEQDIRKYAWLYFPTYLYENGMEEKSWKTDKRMGIQFIDAMNELEQEGLVYKESEVWHGNKPQAKEKLIEVFKPATTREDAEQDRTDLEKYDIKNIWSGYTISRIPRDIYEREKHHLLKDNKVEKQFDWHDYDKIKKWYAKYQRTTQPWWNDLNMYVGATNDLIKNEEYKLFRGIFLPEQDVKEGDLFPDKGMSWTSSPHMAERFAYDNTNWMDRKTKIPPGMMGLVLVHTFEPDEIFMDTEFVNEMHPVLQGMVDFPNEKEVVVKPMKRMVKIAKVLK